MTLRERSIETGKRLRLYRNRAKVSAQAAANAVGVSVSTYRDWENGRMIMGEPYIELAKLFGISVADLLGVSTYRPISTSD